MAKMLLTHPYTFSVARLKFSGPARKVFAVLPSLQLHASSLKTESRITPGYAVAPGVLTVCDSKFRQGYIHAGRVGRRIISTKATTNVNDPGSIDSSMMQSMEKKIKEELNAESVTVTDAYGDGRHVSIYVVASTFEGQSAVSRQRAVYKAIWEELQSTVHAVDQMVTKTPAEVAG